jgi:hypothetical protein
MGLLNWLESRFGKRRLPQDSVFVDDQGVRLLSRDGTVGSVKWDELQAVVIETTDQGPFVEDVFFVLVGKNAGCAVPHGADGTDALFKRLGELPGFDYDAACRAMSCAENNRFLCWKRENTATTNAE